MPRRPVIQRERGRVVLPAPGDRWIAGGLVLLFAGLVFAIAVDHEPLLALCALGLLAGIPWYLGRGRERLERKEAARQAELRPPTPPAEPESLPRRIAALWFKVAACTLVLGIVLSLKLFMPLHVSLSSGDATPLLPSMIPALAAGVLLFLVAYLLAYIHQGTAAVVLWVSAVSFSTGLFGLGLGAILDAANVFLDTSPVRQASARVLAIQRPRTTTRNASSTIVLLGGPPDPRKEIRARYHIDVFRLDVDSRHAMYFWREGFLGRPYAVAYRG